MSEDNRIGANDLVNMASIIEICSQRGAFKASELKLVGTLHDKLSNFIQKMQETQKAEAEAEAENAEENGESTPTNESANEQPPNVKNV